MKKVLTCLLIISCFMFKSVVYAGTASITTASSYALVGNKVYVTVNVSGLAGKFKVTSSDTSILSGGTSGIFLDDESRTFTFTANGSGTATVTLTPLDVADYSDNTKYTASKSIKIIVSWPSSNNYLSNLEVDDYDLSPAFDEDVFEYDVEVPNDVRKVHIYATRDSSSSSVKGTGEVSLEEGVNTFDIDVTAQNGNVRTYTVNIIVKELEPIEVNVGDSKYTIIRKKELLPTINPYFKASIIKIGDNEIPCYVNEETNMTLVGLRSGDSTKLFIYDGKYKLYEEIAFANIYIQVLDLDTPLDGYTLTKIDIGSKSYTAYTKEGYEYPVIYGMNVKTGEKSLYKYDAKENTIQRMENIEIKTNEQLYFIIAVSSLGFIVVSYILFIIILANKVGKKTKKVKKEKYDFDI